MSLRNRIILSILFCATLVALCVGVPMFMGSQQLAREGGNREMAQLWGRAQNVLNARIRTAESFTAMVASMPRVQRAVDKADNKGLQRLFAKDFDTFSAQTGIAQFQFHTPDAISILRVHNPEKFGDDLSGFRPLVVQSNATQQPLSGLERGRAGLGIRAIHPVEAGGGHAGTVEVGLRLDAELLAQMVEGTDSAIELYILPDTNVDSFDPATGEMAHLAGGWEGPALLSNQQVLDTVQTPGQDEMMTINGHSYLSRHYVLNDFSGQPVAVANVLLSRANYLAIEQRNLAITGAAALAALLLAAVLAWITGRRLTGALNSVVSRMRSLADGQTDVTYDDLKGRGAEITHMAEGLEVFRDGLIEADALRADESRRKAEQEAVVARLAEGLRDIAAGRLDAQITEDLGPDYARLVGDFNSAVTQLAEVIADISSSSQMVNSSAAEIGRAAEDLSNRTETSAATLEQTAAALQEITTAVQESARGAQSADTSGRQAIDKAQAGSSIVTNAVEAIREVERSSDEIAQIIGMIDDIAFQTNLLALNAGVEAARAGEAGSGFAVVAAEVRALAARTADSAQQIGKLIDDSGDKVQHGVSLVTQTGTALQDIVSAIEDVSAQVGRIATLAEEQVRSLGEINTAVSHLDHATQSNAGMFSQTSAASANLLAEGERLAALVGRFRAEAQGFDAEAEPVASRQAG